MRYIFGKTQRINRYGLLNGSFYHKIFELLGNACSEFHIEKTIEEFTKYAKAITLTNYYMIEKYIDKLYAFFHSLMQNQQVMFETWIKNEFVHAIADIQTVTDKVCTLYDYKTWNYAKAIPNATTQLQLSIEAVILNPYFDKVNCIAILTEKDFAVVPIKLKIDKVKDFVRVENEHLKLCVKSDFRKNEKSCFMCSYVQVCNKTPEFVTLNDFDETRSILDYFK